MTVQDYELLLRVRADLQQALGGLDGMRKKLDTVGTETERTSQRAGKAVDGLGSKFAGLKTLVGGLAIGAGIKAILDAVTESEAAVAQLDARLKSTGSAAGLTRDELINLSGELQNLTTYGDEAVLQMENLLLTFTDIRGPVFKEATSVILDISTALGQDLQSSATQVGKALNDPILGISALSRVGVNFTESQKEVIKKLVETGDKAGAQTVILKELEKEFGGAAQAAANTFGGALEQLKNAAGDLLEGDGGNLTDTTSSIKELTKTLQDPSIKQGFATLVDGLVAVAGYSAKALAGLASFSKFVGEQFARSQGYFAVDDAIGIESRLSDIKDRLKEINDTANMSGLKRVFAGTGGKAAFGFNLDDERKALEVEEAKLKALLSVGESLKAGSKPKAAPALGSAGNPQSLPDLTVVASAAPTAQATESISKFIAAGTSLQQKLIDMQAAINPTAKAWADYNKVVAQTNAQAAEALKAPKANAAAINGERDAIIQLAAAARDAEIKKIADADRQAFDQLRDSLRTPAGVQLDTAAQQILQLNQYLKDGVISSKEYHDALSAVAANSVGNDLPQYQGVDAAVGGVTSELSKNFEAEQALNDAYAQKLAANEAFRAKDAANEEVYQQRLAALQGQYATQRNKIEDSRQQLQLQSSSDFFGQLAVLSRSGNSKIAAIGKTAAIAKTIIDTYSSATAAYKSLASIPYVGPALGAAAAAAAIAAGLANVAQIRSQPTGFSGGGYTGPGGKYEYAGPAHKGEVIWSQEDVARVGGVSVAEAIRLGKARGYADGGVVGIYSSAAATPTPDSYNLPAAQPAQAATAPAGSQKHVHLWDKNQAAQEIASTQRFEEAVLHIVGNNPSTIKGRWG